MTCIVGCKVSETGIIYMGTDSFCGNDREVIILAEKKVARNREMLIGCSGSPRIGNILQHVLIPPVYQWNKNESLLSFLLIEFTKAIKRCLKYAGEDPEKLEDSTLLIGLHGRLFRMEENVQIEET